MISFEDALSILNSETELTETLIAKISFVEFEQLDASVRCLRNSATNDLERERLAKLLPSLLVALAETADCDRSIRNFERFMTVVENRQLLYERMIEQPRLVEILIRLFVGSQYLSEILLRNPSQFHRLSEYKRLAEFKSREEFIEVVRNSISTPDSLEELKDQLRSIHQWEILRIAACDTFRLVDLKTVTLQLSLLADAIVQVALEQVLRLESVSESTLAVIAFGKLGGLELNYSSDIDLVFVCEGEPERYFSVGQKLIKVISDFTQLGFLYRVDMRLRPWGTSGPLVCGASDYQSYFGKHAQLWEHQALLKARVIAGHFEIGSQLLNKLHGFECQADNDSIRKNICRLKDQVEAKESSKLVRRHSIKNGPGGIRDVEFLVQYLQLMHGKQIPAIRRVGTMESLIYLSDANLLNAQEFRTLSNAYVIFRTIEHSLQLMHNQQESFLPDSPRELNYLARRLDFPDANLFLQQLRQQTDAVRKIFNQRVRELQPAFDLPERAEKISRSPEKDFVERFDQDQFDLVRELNLKQLIRLRWMQLENDAFEAFIVARNHRQAIPIICGMLFVNRFDIVAGSVEVFSSNQAGHDEATYLSCRLTLRLTQPLSQSIEAHFWRDLEVEFNELMHLASERDFREVQSRLVKSFSDVVTESPKLNEPLLPVEITFAKDQLSQASILQIGGRDVPGFLFELTNAISMIGLTIEKMDVRSSGDKVYDTLHVVNPASDTPLNEQQQNQLRATIVLIKQFTHLLPNAPNPETAMAHFQGLLENLFQQTDWLEQLQALQQPDVLQAISRLLGVSNFLWEDFLRLQHENLFPVVTDLEGLQHSKTREELSLELNRLWRKTPEPEPRETLNRFKDREMMRVDMRHILGLETAFGAFSQELTDVAEAIVDGALELAWNQLLAKHGRPLNLSEAPGRISVCALGKCGGRELGYASDIELMFVFDEPGQTSGPKKVRNIDFYHNLVKLFQKSIYSRSKRIFSIDLRLRPYGNAGSLAVSRSEFEKYFAPTGPAWPYERQALVKLRPIAGDSGFGEELVKLRDDLIYQGVAFDLAAMRAMREKQIRQLENPGSFHAKLSPGGLVDCEYFVQGLQLTFGHLSPEIRNPNTRSAMKGLEQAGILTCTQRIELRDAYRFLRRLIDGMRMVRGDATDLTIPEYGTEEFDFLSKRLEISKKDLHSEIEYHTCKVMDMMMSFEEFSKVEPDLQE